MLTCNTCSQQKPEADYYVSNRSRCKECTKARARANRDKRIAYYRAYDRLRYSTDPARKEAARVAVKRRRRNSPLKASARIAVGNAIRDGRLVPQPCEKCSTTVDVQAHHDDYSKPLDVRWLCVEHHFEHHREENRRKRAA